MPITNYFYNETTRKYIALFGTLFNKISIARYEPADRTTPVQSMIVPISYGPYQKFLARITQDPNLDRKPAITLPRMAFEMTSMSYDGTRKVNSLKKISTTGQDLQDSSAYQYAPAPYNIEFSLYVMTKYAEDGTQVLEQVVPFFKPELTTTVKLIEGMEPLDIPLILNSVSVDDIYEGDFETRRSLMWTLNFTMKAWYFGPVREKKIIKFIDLDFYDDTTDDARVQETVTIQPGLTANGQPTSDINETVPYEQIDFEDDWGIITIIEQVNENV